MPGTTCAAASDQFCDNPISPQAIAKAGPHKPPLRRSLRRQGPRLPANAANWTPALILSKVEGRRGLRRGRARILLHKFRPAQPNAPPGPQNPEPFPRPAKKITQTNPAGSAAGVISPHPATGAGPVPFGCRWTGPGVGASGVTAHLRPRDVDPGKPEQMPVENPSGHPVPQGRVRSG